MIKYKMVYTFGVGVLMESDQYRPTDHSSWFFFDREYTGVRRCFARSSFTEF